MFKIAPDKVRTFQKILSSLAATCISLACGTNYAYSAWGPQLSERLNLSSTQQNLIGLSGNLGMYVLGIPIGIFVDQKGAKIPLISGGVLLGFGYYMLYNSYTSGSGYLPFLCLFAFFTGYGSCASYSATIKVSALNWPEHRGTATAFPAAAFGLSAFIFSSAAELLVPGDTSYLLLVLATGTFGLVIIGSFFLRIVTRSESSSIPCTARNSQDTNHLRRITSEDLISTPLLGKYLFHDVESDTPANHGAAVLLPRSLSFSSENTHEGSSEIHTTHKQNSGLQILKSAKFWHLFVLMGILAGIALMTINNIGNNVRTLWRHWDQTKSEKFIIRHEALQVSIISICSFLGRIMAGIGSDILVKTFNASRLWFLNFSCILYFIAQLFALSNQDPRLLFLVSAPTGLAYGFLYGIYPSQIAETFGVGTLSQNFGVMLLSPVISGNILNIFYGKIYDKHTILAPNNHRVCTEGLFCYRDAYLLTTFACLLGLGVNLWSINYTHRLRQRKNPSINDSEL